ncbi:MAG TPA: hypothetical protein VFP47_10915, partial [Pyrinomonadaceae bacterium]|nr:hypothetical protein [Pyrinomonadaceae bacterium]
MSPSQAACRRAPRPVLIFLLVLSAVVVVTWESFQTTVGAATTFVVTNTNDSGAGSLRQAILDANANPGADSITFTIGSGLQTITPTSLLPDISDPVVINGTTQPGFAGTPLIELSASSIPSHPNRGVLHITAGNTTLRGLVINRFRD